jgi:hypothetical protein
MLFELCSQDFQKITDIYCRICFPGEFMKYLAMFALLFAFACSHQGDRSISSIEEDTPEVPEDYRIACVAKGGALEAGECQCLNGGKFIDPYEVAECPTSVKK